MSRFRTAWSVRRREPRTPSTPLINLIVTFGHLPNSEHCAGTIRPAATCDESFIARGVTTNREAWRNRRNFRNSSEVTINRKAGSHAQEAHGPANPRRLICRQSALSNGSHGFVESTPGVECALMHCEEPHPHHFVSSRNRSPMSSARESHAISHCLVPLGTRTMHSMTSRLMEHCQDALPTLSPQNHRRK